jgi:hypothetical protein
VPHAAIDRIDELPQLGDDTAPVCC